MKRQWIIAALLLLINTTLTRAQDDFETKLLNQFTDNK
jgi:hypothetical protein